MSDILTLNSPKTEFLIIGLKQQLSRIDNSSLSSQSTMIDGLSSQLSRRHTCFNSLWVYKTAAVRIKEAPFYCFDYDSSPARV